MMDRLLQYVISFVTTALICGVASGLLQKSAAKELINLVCGLFLAITVISPIASIDLSLLTDFPMSFSDAARTAASDGENMVREALGDIIKAEAEAYVLDKAAELNADISVEITVGEEDPPIPVEAKISGQITPYARQQLQTVLHAQLGISKENQQWTGQH